MQVGRGVVRVYQLGQVLPEVLGGDWFTVEAKDHYVDIRAFDNKNGGTFLKGILVRPGEHYNFEPEKS
jgi:hypothetical protein